MTTMENRDNSKGKRGLKRAGILLLALGVIGVALACLRIDTVTVEGSRHYTEAEFEAMLFPTSWDRNPLVFWLHENTGETLDVPFVDRYSVEMEGLTTVHIIVYEKEIVGYIDRRGTYMYFDRDGVVVESASEEMEDVPRVIGLGGARVEIGDRLPIEDDAVMNVVLSVSQFLQTRSILWDGEERAMVTVIDRIYVDEKANVTCILGDLQVYLGGNANMEEKLLLMSDILPKLADRTGTIYLDNYSDSVENPSYVFREGVLLLTPGVYDVEVLDYEEEPETLSAEEMSFAETGDGPEAAETSGSAEETQAEGEQTAETEAENEPETTAAETAEHVDGDGVDDIPEDYVGGDGYGH